MRYAIFDTPVLSTLLRSWAAIYLRMFGWRREGHLPDVPRYVVIAAPHTTNWELPTALMLAFAFRVKIRWIGKDSLFQGPFGAFFKWLGGIPVDRGTSNGMVEQIIHRFHENVPIVLGFIDYRRKVGGIGPVVTPTGNIESDMKVIRAFYAGVTGKHPEQSSNAFVEAAH